MKKYIVGIIVGVIVFCISRWLFFVQQRLCLSWLSDYRIGLFTGWSAMIMVFLLLRKN